MIPLSAEYLAELRTRIPLPELIGSRVKLARSGRNWIGCCPFHAERTPSFHVYADHYHCFGCSAHGDGIEFLQAAHGVGFMEAVRLLASDAGIALAASGFQATAPAKPVRAPELTATVKQARALFQESTAAPGTLADAYLRSRGCALPKGSVIRFHPKCPRFDEQRGLEHLPAMMSAMTCPLTNAFVGVHRTFLRADGTGKIEHGKAKMMLGNAGVIRLSPNDEITIGLGICEGIETGLAIIQQAGWSAIWAAASSGGMAKFPVLVGIECLTLFPDMDDSGAGRNAATACAHTWAAAGREVQTIWPPGGTDWHDRLVKTAA